jgi:hypothetical protein
MIYEGKSRDRERSIQPFRLFIEREMRENTIMSDNSEELTNNSKHTPENPEDEEILQEMPPDDEDTQEINVESTEPAELLSHDLEVPENALTTEEDSGWVAEIAPDDEPVPDDFAGDSTLENTDVFEGSDGWWAGVPFTPI